MIATINLNPSGFWQNLALAGIGLYIFGGIQLLLLLLFLVISVYIWAAEDWAVEELL